MIKTSQKTILLVEDEALIAMDEKSTLEDYGYSVITAHSGEDAVQIVDSGKTVDLILMDINLGEGMDGTDAAKIILENHDLPLIFLSSHTEREVVEKTEGITSYGYIVKNSGETVLIQSIKMAFRLFNAQLSKKKKEDLKLKSMILDQIKDYVTITDTNGIITYVNKVQEKDLGLSKEEMIGKSTTLFGEDSETGATQEEILTKTLKNGSWRGEVVNYTADGREIVLDCRTQLIYDEKGNPVSLCGISTDITEHKKFQNTLRRNEHLHRLILSAIPDMLMRFDKEGTYLDVVNYREDELAMPKDEVMGKRVSAVIPGELGRRLENAIRSVEKTGEMQNIEYDLTVPAGDCTFETRIVPFLKNEVIALVRDITQRKKAEKALGESVRTYRDLIDGMTDTVWVIGTEGSLLDVNKTAENLLGYTKEELFKIGLLGIDSSLEKDHIIQLVKTMPEDKVQIFETEHKAKNGTRIPVEICSSIITYYGKKAILSIARTITERKKSDDKIKALLAEKELLLKETHHRIKNNMGTVKSLLSLQAHSIKDPESRKILQDAAGRIQSMMVLYDKLYRSEGYHELNIKAFLPSLIREIIALYSKGNPVKTTLELEDITLDARTLSTLGIILNECISNSMKHAFGQVKEPLITVQASKKNNKIVLIYQDNGTGVINASSSGNNQSFGLKLIDMLVDQLGGSMRVDGSKGMKTRIEF